MINMLVYQILASTMNGKISHKNNNFEYLIKKHDTLLGHTTKILTDYPPIRIYVNKNEYRITFITKSGYYLERLKHEYTK